MIDTHTHLYLPEFSDPEDLCTGVAAVDRAVSSGISHMVLPNVDASTIEPMMTLHRARQLTTSVAMGLHPTEVSPGWESVTDRMEEMMTEGGYVAVGEVGMDLYWDKTHREDQLKAFARQLRMASRLSLPVIIHCREALGDTLEVIRNEKVDVPLVFHSFTGGKDEVHAIRDVCDAMFGINGVVTFKNARDLRDAIPEIGIGRILLETDSPYLSPVPFRGKRNESSHLPHILNAVASAAGIPVEEAEAFTDANARKIFGL